MGAPVTRPRGQGPAGAAEDCAVRFLAGRDCGDEGAGSRELVVHAVDLFVDALDESGQGEQQCVAFGAVAWLLQLLGLSADDATG